MSNASVSVYKRPWKLFTDWSASYLGDMPINLPLQPAILALFIAHLYSRSYSSSSVTTYISAISYVHKLAGVADPTEGPLIIQIERARANSKTQHVNSRSANVLLLPNHKKVNSYKERKNNSYNTEQLL